MLPLCEVVVPKLMNRIVNAFQLDDIDEHYLAVCLYHFLLSCRAVCKVTQHDQVVTGFILLEFILLHLWWLLSSRCHLWATRPDSWESFLLTCSCSFAHGMCLWSSRYYIHFPLSTKLMVQTCRSGTQFISLWARRDFHVFIRWKKN